MSFRIYFEPEGKTTAPCFDQGIEPETALKIGKEFLVANATPEARPAVVVRDKPSPSSKCVDRIVWAGRTFLY